MKYFRKPSKRQAISLLSLFVFIFTLAPAWNVRADTALPFSLSATYCAGGSDKALANGQKGIDSGGLSSIELTWDSSHELKTPQELGSIQVLANGAENETYKFTITANDNEKGKGIKLKLKDQLPGTPYQLMAHAVYDVILPRDAFTPLLEEDAHFSFRTEQSQVIKLEKDTFNNGDFIDGSEDIFILGANFTTENWAEVQLTPSEGKVKTTHPEAITVGGSVYDDTTTAPVLNESNLYVQSNERLRLNISGEIAREFSADDYAGTYTVSIKFKEKPTISSDIGVLTILPKGKPVRIARNPDSGSTWYDQFAINPIANVYGQTRYFIKLTYRDDYSALQIIEADLIRNLKNCSICAEGGSQASMIDQELLDIINQLSDAARNTEIKQYLFTKDPVQKLAYLNIPIKILRPQTNYSVAVGENIVAFSNGGEGNDAENWTFTTLSVPLVSGVSPCSVGEDYHNNEFIMVTGDFFYQGQGGLRVRFSTGNDTDTVSSSWMADRVEVVTVEGKVSLKVYLPYNGGRLKAGTYNITVMNGEQHKETLYGALSVIPGTDREKPIDGQRVDNAVREGDVVASVNRSSSSLKLSSRYANKSFVELNMDELLGQDVWERKITIEPRKRDRIGELRTISSWATVSFYGVQYAGASRDNPSEIRAGRAAPVQARSLQSKLGRQGLHSEIIEATVDGLGVDAVSLSIPFRNSDGQNLQAMQYDTFLRKWQQVPSQINWVDQTLSISGARPGFFAIVESGGSN